ncbi:hypothetical protein T4E_11674 [Trichinella pseudospiralis]|uniref:Uncharacterized protein n=1 Tax=Trichinella pseudospiralis TaxID=6337 RepID=A0A0V0XJQ0_TRIPS|nr:hypothetical protein T4E_11674 [Trichinella pseudospiralis]
MESVERVGNILCGAGLTLYHAPLLFSIFVQNAESCHLVLAQYRYRFLSSLFNNLHIYTCKGNGERVRNGLLSSPLAIYIPSNRCLKSSSMQNQQCIYNNAESEMDAVFPVWNDKTTNWSSGT